MNDVRCDAADITADVCVIGAGPAGIAMARELARTRLVTCMVESGGEVLSAAADDLARGVSEGEPIHPLAENTRRVFGGASQAWDIRTGKPERHVRHMPLDAEDFDDRPWLAHGGWPFARSALAPFYERAQSLCGIGPFDEDAASWETPEARRFPLNAAVLTTAICQFGPAALFHRDYREDLREAERAGRLRLLLDTTALRLLPARDGGAVHALLCARPDGTRQRIRARAFVLAAGGHQNARLLLLSDDADPRGLGNSHDVVGRYLHDHPLIFAGLLQPADAALFQRAALYDIRLAGGVPAMGYLALSPELRRRERLPAVASFLFPRPEPRSTHALEALRDGLRALRGLGRLPISPLNVAKLFARRPGVTLRGALEAARGRPVLSGFKVGGWSRQRAPGSRWQSFHVWQQVEQSPEPGNRVLLGNERDRFDCRLPLVHWRWSADDDARIARAQTLMADEIDASGLGHLALSRRDGRTDLAYPAGAHHVMGTTRMHADPHRGVVDAECRVHGIANLFIAGSSVFPTGGSANPTLTILALAIRLADRLRVEFDVAATSRQAPPFQLPATAAAGHVPAA